MDIIQERLAHQFLGTKKLTSPAEVVTWFGAVQAQDFHAAKRGLSLRLKGATDALLEKEFNSGKFLRTHVMRPTWHFVPPENIRWMQQATAHRVRPILAHYDRRLEIDRTLIRKAERLFEKVLRDRRFLTREELAEELDRIDIPASGQRLAHLVMHAELDALICSGPRNGKQFTYALLDERAPKQKKIPGDEALATLAATYFQSHGPAQLKDFAWWSGLTMNEAERGLGAVQRSLNRVVMKDKEYWFTPGIKTPNRKSPSALLLSIYDEYTIAYKDRSALGSAEAGKVLISLGNALTSVFTIDGTIAGTWIRTIKKETVEITVSPLRQIRKDEKEAVKAAADEYGKFMQMEIKIVFK